MGLPPILSSLPIFKSFKSDNAQSKQAEESPAPQSPQDVVELSAAAQSRLEGAKTLNSEAEASETARETGALVRDSDLPLGLDSSFDAS